MNPVEHKAVDSGWVTNLCHCGASIFANHAVDGTALGDAHRTRCCNCFDSWVIRDEADDKPWFCAQCSSEGAS